jgi:hypothetical protein
LYNWGKIVFAHFSMSYSVWDERLLNGRTIEEKKILTMTKKQSRKGPQASIEWRFGFSKALILSEESVNLDPDAP